MKKSVLISSLAVGLLTTSVVPAFAAVSFTDVKKTDWFYNTIEYGEQNNMISGYLDGTFRPNQTVMEGEFVKMFLSAYLPIEAGQGNNWADPYYDYAEKMNYPVTGNRNEPITRGVVAEIVSAAAGVNYQGDNAVIYLLGNGLAKGKVAGEVSVRGYQGNSLLTRAEAVQFIKNAKENGLSELSKRPTSPSPTNQLPKLPEQPKPPVGQVPAGTPQAVADLYNKLITDGTIAKYTQFEAKAGSGGITMFEGKATVSVVYDDSAKEMNQVILWKNDAKGAADFAIDAIKAIGAPMTKEAEFKKAIENSRTSTDVVEFKGGGWRIKVIPHPVATDKTYIEIWRP
ncbi:S-layer homology domain-containing protein [Brevibacillus panacihumi]|uniref:S-layer homology domain-containing protein n=1 Tax=Brevibacillus panacihumi TaxID=497735 RepID=UPI003D236E7F